MRIWYLVLTAMAGLIGWAEWETWTASRDGVGSRADDGTTAIVVLGCPLPVLQRWRVRIAVRSADRHRSRFVFSGAAVGTPVSEARMMADYAIDKLGVPPENVVIEDSSRTTVENVVNTIDLIGDASMIMFASNTFHARRARQVMHVEQPELARRLVGARDYIPLEWGLLHLLLAAFEQSRQRRAERSG